MFEMLSPTKKGGAAQKLINISEIRDGVLILKDGTMRMILMASSINFALKSEDEQNAIIFAYQDLINTLEFPIQVTVSSRKMDIMPYIGELKDILDKQRNELLRLQMHEYINFIEELTKQTNIMTKSFFITIPFAVTQSRKENFFTRIIKGAKSAAGKHVMTNEEFEYNKAQLLQRVEQIALALRQIGIRVVPLATQELLELFYTFYNPNTSRNQRLSNIGSLKVEETEKKEKESPQKPA